MSRAEVEGDGDLYLDPGELDRGIFSEVDCDEDGLFEESEWAQAEGRGVVRLVARNCRVAPRAEDGRPQGSGRRT